MSTYRFKSELWLYPGMAAWHFITVPKLESEEIKLCSGPRRGWGSVRVEATIGKTTWKSSIFPDKAREAYLLPVKAEVRKREKLTAGQEVELSIRLE